MLYKNGQAIPLTCESDGIKKILTILPWLIEVYNCRSLTVAADDWDTGLFEYLFGELLAVFSQGGRGQLIFTAYNLRALEVLNSAGAAVTTADPSNRFTHLKTTGLTGNLRDAYYRQLILGAGADSGVGRLQQKEQSMRRSAAAGMIRSIGTADSCLVVPTVKQHVALLVNTEAAVAD